MKKIVTTLILILSTCFTYQLQAADILVNSSGLPGSYLKANGRPKRMAQERLEYCS